MLEKTISLKDHLVSAKLNVNHLQIIKVRLVVDLDARFVLLLRRLTFCRDKSEKSDIRKGLLNCRSDLVVTWLSVNHVLSSMWVVLLHRSIPVLIMIKVGLDPPCMNKKIKKLIHEKKSIFSCFRRNHNDKQLLDRLKDLQAQLNFLIEKSKGKYYSRLTSKLSGIGKSSKAYWSILKSLIYCRFQEKSGTIQFIFCKPVLFN